MPWEAHGLPCKLIWPFFMNFCSLLWRPHNLTVLTISPSSQRLRTHTFDTVRAGDHWSFRISRQMLPLALIFGW